MEFRNRLYELRKEKGLSQEELANHLDVTRQTIPKRGMGYGKQMIRLALQFAFDILKAQKVTLGVLENNPGAYHCYKAAGFRDVAMDEPAYYHLMGEQIKCFELATEREP